MTEQSAASFPIDPWQAFQTRDRLILAAVSTACVGAFYFLSRMLGWPVFAGYEGSLLASAAPVTL